MPATAPSLQRSEAEQRRALLDISSYDVVLDLTTATTGDLTAPDATFTSVTTIVFTSGAGATFLDLKAVSVSTVRLDGQPVDVERLAAGRLPLDLDAGDHELVVEAVMEFRHDGEGLHLAHDPADGMSYVYGMSFMDAAPSWFACFDQPDLKATYTFRVCTPPDWTVFGNALCVAVEPGRWELGPTPPISTYVTTLVAGPWHVLRSEHDGVALSLSARASLAEVLDRDAEDLFRVTRQSFDDLHGRFGIRYPFGDYHQAFVPEFNAGAMENPGCVTFRDSYLSTSRLTRIALSGRASTIAHEMAHQWFGNLVTPVWWDDLWLNESFAEYLGNRVTAESTEYAEMWVDDIHARRQWGLIADQRPTTHPIAGNGAADAEEALQNFDGISYAKGACVLRQLAATLGDEVFFGGVVDHLTRHRFGNATMADLVASWERSGAGDLSGFVDSWLLTAGPDRLEPDRLELDRLELDRGGDAVTCTPPPEHPADRTHAVEVAVHRNGAWQRQRLTIAGASTPLDVEARDRPVLVDTAGESWALTIPDPDTIAALVDLLPAMTDPLLRATTWSSLRNAFHNAELDPRDAFALALAALPLEDPGDSPLRTMGWIRRQVIPLQPDPDAARARLHETAAAHLTEAEATSERQLAAFRAVVATSTDAETLTAWSDAQDVPDGLDVDVDLRWRVLSRLAQLGATDPDRLDRALAADPSVDARIAHSRARACLPSAEAKAWAWERFTGRTAAPNHEIDAAGAGFWQPGQEAVTAAYVDRYFDDLPATAEVRSGWTLAEVAQSFFPWTSLDQGTLDRAQAMADDVTLDVSLRRRLADEADGVRRMLAVRARW